MEIWKDVVGYEGLYQVSNYGRVKSFKRKNSIILKPIKSDNGYLKVILRDGKYAKTIAIHRLVAICFIPNPYDKKQVNHMDTNKSNNHVDNLEWSTPKENINHAWENGIYNSRGNNHVLNKDMVIDIRTRRLNGEKRIIVYKDYQDIISLSGFKKVWYNENWKDIKGE